ncbi:MAG: DUF1236 domain-containing protein [Bradyrhizobium sp.]
MINRLMVSVAAAALIAGTGFANAQGTGMSREAPSAAPAQQSAPAAEHSESDRGKSGGEMKRDAKPEMKSTQSEEKSPAAGKNQRAEDGMQGQKSKTMSSDEKSDQKSKMSAEEKPGQKSKTMSSDEKPDQKSKAMSSENDNAKGGKDMKAEGQDRNGTKNADSKGGAEGKTVGQAGAGAKLSTEQRTKITTVIKEQHIAPVTNVNFSISVGTRVPRDVSFHPLPAEIVTVYPDWRGYEFILVRNQILVIDPSSLEIVAVLDA